MKFINEDIGLAFTLSFVIFMLLLLNIIGWTVGHYRAKAIEYGIGQYVITNKYTGEVDFVWKEIKNEKQK